jgi:hypothetical protein
LKFSRIFVMTKVVGYIIIPYTLIKYNENNETYGNQLSCMFYPPQTLFINVTDITHEDLNLGCTTNYPLKNVCNFNTTNAKILARNFPKSQLVWRSNLKIKNVDKDKIT